MQAEQILISKNIRNLENHLPLWWKKDSVVSNALQKQLGYDGETESFMLPVLVGNEMLLISTGNP